MPKSVIDIDVRDAKFKEFIALFNKYQKGLKDQSHQWRQAGEEVVAIAAGLGTMTAAFLEQNAAFEEGRKAQNKADRERKEARADARNLERKAEREKDKADKDKTKSEKAREKREKESAARTKKAISDTMRLGGAIKNVAVGLTKFAIFDVVAGALGLWGVDAFINSVGNQRREAAGYGIGVGENLALKLAYGRYYNSGQAVDALANAQMDVTKAWIFSGMGIQNPYGQDPAGLLIQAGNQARRQISNVPLNQRLNYAAAHGFDQVFQPEDLRRILSANPKEWANQAAQYKEMSVLFKRTDEIGERFQTLGMTLAKAGTTIEAKLIDTIDKSKLPEALDRVIGKFTDLAVHVIDRIDWKVLEQGLDNFADYLGSKKFQQDFKLFTDSVSDLANNIVLALRYFKLIPDDPNALSKRQQEYSDILSGKDPGDQNMNTLSGIGLGDFKVLGDAKVSKRDLAAMSMLMSPPFGPGGKGWDANAAAAIVASAEAESGNTADPIDPKTGKPQPWGSAHYGAFQWDTTRQAQFNAWAKNLGWPDLAHSTLGEQYAFANYEILNNKRFAKVKRELMAQSGKDIGMDTATMLSGYEQPYNFGTGQWLSEYKKRANLSSTILSVYVNNNIPGPPVPNQMSAASK